MNGFVSVSPAISRPQHEKRSGMATRRTAVNCMPQEVSRRQILSLALSALSSGLALPVNATMYDYSVKATGYQRPEGDPKLVGTWLPQIEAGYAALLNLEENWEATTRDFDGDIVRRAIGTVGVKSPLFNVKKAFEGAWNAQKIADIDIDILEEIQDDYNDVLNKIAEVDFQLYSVNFTELRPTKQALVDSGKETLDKLIVVYKHLIDLLKSE